MFSTEASCSDCKIEFIRKKWSKLLLNWINKCVHDKGKGNREKRLNMKCLTDIMTKYKDDVCEDDFDKAILCTDDIESFIMYKYPILRLRYLSEDQDLPKKLFIMASILLFYCCVRSRSGAVHDDIYSQLKKNERELILKFCERLSDMEITISNVEVAIQEAFEYVIKQHEKPSPDPSLTVLEGNKSSDTAAQMSISSTAKSSLASLPSDTNVADESAVTVQATTKQLKLISDLTVPENSKYAETIVVSEAVVAQQCASSDFRQTCELDRTKSSKNESTRDFKNGELDKTKSSKNESKRDFQNDEKERNKSPKEERKNTMKEQIYERKVAAVMHKQFQKEQVINKEEIPVNKGKDLQLDDSNCSCTRCDAAGPCCGDPASTMRACECEVDEKPSQPSTNKLARLRINRKITALLVAIALFIIIAAVLMIIAPLLKQKKQAKQLLDTGRIVEKRQVTTPLYQLESWVCKNKMCQRVFDTTNKQTHPSHSRCTLTCSGPQIWPQPTGPTEYSNKIVILATDKLKYKLKTVPSDNLQRHLADAFKLFIGELAKLERSGRHLKAKGPSLDAMKMNIQIDVETDPDPRMRLNTDESYQLDLKTINNLVVIKISSPTFCGVRHGLETLTQIILLDESTGYLVTVANASIKDAPSYKYRGLMIKTGRNYIPGDLMRTIDAMATVKLNTFHWRIDVTSFPYLPKLQLEHGAFDRSKTYTKDDVETIVRRAGVRGIRVLIEVAFPGSVGMPWIWGPDKVPSRNNSTCDKLCTVLKPLDSVLDVLQDLYEHILNVTEVDDMFHLSHGAFSPNCYNLNQEGFLNKALDRLKRANKGNLPKLPIIWFTPHLADSESKIWEGFGVQVKEWKPELSLEKFRVIDSSKWELSCEINQRCKKYRNWQEMYSWRSWRDLEAISIEGGEATFWTDFIDPGNLDHHLWPRTAAVAERLWSDVVANATADGSVYVRLNSHRSRMLLAGVRPQAIWPAWCTSNPGLFLKKVL